MHLAIENKMWGDLLWMIYTLLFISLVSTGSCKSRSESQIPLNSGSCIESVFNTDSILGINRNHDSETISLSEAITRYVDAFDSISFDDCPLVLKQSFSDHLEAWRNMLEVTDNYPNLRGEMHNLFDQLDAGQDSLRFRTLLAQVWSTWSGVESHLSEKN